MTAPHGDRTAWERSIRALVAEVARLRALVYEHAQGCHWKAAGPAAANGRCVCEGCELVRAMDDVDVPQPADPWGGAV